MEAIKLLLLRELPENQLSAITSEIQLAYYGKGDVILPRGTVANVLYVVEQGRVRESTCTANGKEVIFNMLFAGDCFGLASAIFATETRSDFIASTKCTISKISSDLLRDVVSSNSRVASIISRNIADQADNFHDKFYELRALSVSERTRAELLRLLLNHSSSVKGKFVEIADMPTHEEIASSVFTHREAVTKEFSRLRRLGVIGLNRGRKLVANVELLREHIADTV